MLITIIQVGIQQNIFSTEFSIFSLLKIRQIWARLLYSMEEREDSQHEHNTQFSKPVKSTNKVPYHVL
jgi:hypothetical protein